jgi:hypothetical protein
LRATPHCQRSRFSISGAYWRIHANVISESLLCLPLQIAAISINMAYTLMLLPERLNALGSTVDPCE